jgi:hypothetical protein
MKKDIGHRIFMIAYRYPICCMAHVLHSICLNPAMLKDYFQVYVHWIYCKLRADRKKKAIS